ncbi:MAG: ABC transporter ATP-binding protein [Chloroflexota bacterium]
MSTLDVRGLEAGYGDVPVLWGVDLSLREGRLTTLVGANGSGKTTLLRAVLGLVKPWHGSVTFDGRDVTRLRAHQKADLGLVLVPEGRQLFGTMTVLENLEMGATVSRARSAMRATMDEVFALYPILAERRAQRAGTLSGGEQQMLAIGRGLMAKPGILVLDEPSLGLSPRVVVEVFETIRNLRRSGLTMLLVEQNVRLSLAISDDAYVMAGGRIELSGPAHELREMPEVQRAYLGT